MYRAHLNVIKALLNAYTASELTLERFRGLNVLQCVAVYDRAV